MVASCLINKVIIFRHFRIFGALVFGPLGEYFGTPISTFLALSFQRSDQDPKRSHNQKSFSWLDVMGTILGNFSILVNRRVLPPITLKFCRLEMIRSIDFLRKFHRLIY